MPPFNAPPMGASTPALADEIDPRLRQAAEQAIAAMNAEDTQGDQPQQQMPGAALIGGSAMGTPQQPSHMEAMRQAFEGGGGVGGLAQRAGDMGLAVATGAAKSLIETADFVGDVAGLPEKPYSEWNPILHVPYEVSADVRRRSPVAGIVGDIAQFSTGMLGVGKLLAPFKFLKEGGAAVKFATEVFKGASAGAIVFDPQQERFSNLIEAYPQLRNPVTAYLAADPSDSDAEGRFKSALEGIGMDLMLAPVFAAATKVLKFAQRGDVKAVEQAQVELQAAHEAAFPGDLPMPKGEGVDLEDTLGDAGPKATHPTDPTDTFVFDGPGALQVEGIPEDLPVGTTVDPNAPTGAGNAGTPQGITTGPDGITVGKPGDEVPNSKAATTPEPTPLDMAVFTKAWQADADAIQQYGSREAAEANGHVFNQGGDLPWQKLQGGGEDAFVTFSDEVAAAFKSDFDTMKGGDVLNDARLDTMVAQRASLYGDDPVMVMGMLRAAGQGANAMAANMEAGFLIANKALRDAYELASRIRMGNVAEFGDQAAAEAALRLRLRFAIEALGNSRAMTAAAGRSLRRMRSEFQPTPEQLAAFDTMAPDDLVELLYRTGGNPKQLAEMSKPGFLDRMVRGAGSLMANNLLWGWPTHVVNLATSAYMTAVRPAERIIGSLLQGKTGMAKTALREYRYMAASVGDAWEAAWSSFLKGDSRLDPHRTEWFTAADGRSLGDMGALGYRPMMSFGDYLHNGFTAIDLALHFPTRGLGMIDEFLKQTSYRGYVQAHAAETADSLGLVGDAYRAHIQKALDDAFDESYRAVDKDALYEAQVRTFQQPLLAKTLGQTLQNAVAVHPSLRAIFPFVRTPVNVFRYAIKNVPGINLIQREYRDMLMGKRGAELQAHAMGQMVLGSLALASASMLASGGHLTGGGPKEPGLRQALEATGWKPYAIIIENENGTHTYIPYNRFDPVGLLFGMATDITEMLVTYPERHEEGENLAVLALMAVAKNMSDRTYLQNLNQFFRAASDPDANMAKTAGQVVEGLIPFSSLLRQSNPDPYQRDARTFMDNVLDRMPGFSEKMPPKRDPFGYPMKVRTGLVFQDTADDIVDAEQQRMILETGDGIAPPTSYKRDGVDLRELTITVDGKPTTAWDYLQQLSIKPRRASRTMKEALAEIIKSDAYASAPDGASDVQGTRAFLLRRVVNEYRTEAFNQLLKEFHKEVGGPLYRRRVEAREALRSKQEAERAAPKADAAKAVNRFAQSYGVNLNIGGK